MKILQRYFLVNISQAVAFVLVALLALIAFMDLTQELPDVGKGGYMMQHALLYVLMQVPGNMYRVMPVAAMLGTIYTMAQFAQSSEFTIMRASSMSTRMAAWILFKIGIVFVIFTFIFGELVTPRTAPLAERVRLYEFDSSMRMRALITAASATFSGNGIWRLQDVTETQFTNSRTLPAPGSAAASGESIQSRFGQDTARVETRKLATLDLASEITPKILSVSRSDPERMSANELAVYTRHLAENRQETERFKIAFWKKLVDPLSIFVLMALALPFGYLQSRSGGVSLKIFVGIMIGVSFLLINSLFSHIGILSTWPAFLTAVAPSLLFLALALGGLRWVERH